MSRPPVSVIVPFSGDEDDARATLAGLERLRLRDGDEVIVVDNSAAPVFARVAQDSSVGVVEARDEQTSYYARNVGAARATGDWLLFTDADCRPRPGILDDYFADEIDSRCGAVAGGIVAPADQAGALARWSRQPARRDDPEGFMRYPFRPFAVTANLLVRRAAYESVGGFLEGIRSGGDIDFSWRLQDAGWTLELRLSAVVDHPYRDRLRPFVRVTARYSAGLAWLNRRWPGAFALRGLRPLLRSLGAALRALPRRERAEMHLIDAIDLLAGNVGFRLSNAPLRDPGAAGGTCLVVAPFPELSRTFVTNELRALQRLGEPVRVEAIYRSWRPQRGGPHDLDVSYLEDDGSARRAAALLWLATRHPFACIRDRRAARRWREGGEDAPRLREVAPAARRLSRAGNRHLHVHFADDAALLGLRLSRLVGVPYSLTAHAYEIYAQPRNLAEKLRGAAFVTSGCEYTVRDLRALVPERADRVHKVIMGIEPERFRRTRPYPGGSTVTALGRLVEKKGFAHLIDAVARLPAPERPDRVVIVGDGPLHDELREQIAALGLDSTVELRGAQDHEDVRDLLEETDLLAMPCVVAADGDRDSMPVVVKEALAMEVPVVASDEVGLPELVRAEWGRLVPPADPDALAGALRELLALAPAERAAMGRAGRAFVVEQCNVDTETRRLLDLLRAT